MPDDTITRARRVIAAGVVLALAVIILAQVFGFIGFFTGDVAPFSPAAAGENTSMPVSNAPDHYDVALTTGNALAFDGNDHVDYGLEASLSTGASVCVTPRLAEGAGVNGTYHVVAGNDSGTRLTVRFSNETWQAYATNGTHDALANVSAPSPKTYTPLCAVYNETHVAIATASESDADELDDTTNVRRVAVDWVGSIDEVRWFNGTISTAGQNGYLAAPVEPLPGEDRALRLLFDDGEGGTTTAYFASYSSVDIGDASWTDGLEGPGLTEGVDYRVYENPFRIQTVGGSRLEGAPVAFLTTFGPFFGVLMTVVNALTGALVLFGLAAVLLAAGGVLDVFDGSGGL